MANQAITDEQKRLYRFLEVVSKLKPIEFIGMAHLLGVPLAKEDGQENRDFDDLLSDMIDKFIVLSAKKQKELIQIAKNAARFRGGMTFGNTTKYYSKKK